MTAALLFLLAQQVFLSEDEAVRILFPNGEKVFRRDVTLDSAVHAAVEARLKRRVENAYRLFVAARDGEAAGYAVVVEEVTKTLTMTFIVGVDPNGRVIDVVVLEHKEKIGGDCAKRKFLDQLRGKTLADPIRRKKDMVHVVGATMSCDAVMRGTRKALAVMQGHFLDRPGNVRAVLQSEPVVQQRQVMGNLITITAYGPKDAVNRALDEARRWDAILSNYKEESDLSRLNREGRSANPDLAAFLGECRKYADLFDGAFDVTVGPLVRSWGFFDRAYRVPSPAELESALKRVGRERVLIEGGNVRLVEGTELDPGAIGKGWAVDRAAEVLRRAGVTAAFVDFGSTVLALGAPPGKEGWTVGIRDPFRTDRVLGTLVVRDASVSTSGSYEKFFEKDGKRYGHILDPRTGRPVEGVASVSVLAPTGTASDALSTAVFVAGLDVAAKAKVEALWIPSDPKAMPRATDGWTKVWRKE
ncbi:MAG: FAD:protein FMN transferase [Planctomycetes bacterium]|nr:FAD:protein FMN transferase [Planctomycetota bacterium]